MHVKSWGFTLIELMITVAVVGILAAIAYPAYTSAIMKSRRAEAKAMLLEVAQKQERFYTEKNTYTTALTGTAGLNYPSGTLKSENGHYTIAAAASSGDGNTIANSFTLTATPTGTQAKDTVCKNFTLTNTNAKGISGTGNVSECW